MMLFSQYLFGILILLACNSVKSSNGTIHCYVTHDSVYVCEGILTESPTFKYRLSTKEKELQTQLLNELQLFNKNEPTGSIVIKTIWFGVEAIVPAVKLKEWAETHKIKNVIVSLEYTNNEMKYFGVHSTKPFEVGDLKLRIPVDNNDAKQNITFKKEEVISTLPKIIENDTLNDLEFKNRFEFKFDSKTVSLFHKDSLREKINNISEKELPNTIIAFIKKYQINNKSTVYIHAKRTTPFKLVDIVMKEFAKNGIDHFKLVTQPD